MISNTKIICTIGPASSDVHVLQQLVNAGMDACRLNFSHSDHKTHLETIKNIIHVRKKTGHPLPIIQDLQGPKIRIGELENKMVELKTGERIIIERGNFKGNAAKINTTYDKLLDELRKGSEIILDDGNLKFIVINKTRDKAICEIIKGGLLGEHKGINLPNTKISLQSLTKKDLEDIAFGVSNFVDMIALSFVRTKDDILKLRKVLKRYNKTLPVISKIEKPEAIINIDGIIEVSDAVMIARGDMGVEISPEDVPVLQKKLILKCNEYHKPVITATQMLESMMINRIPTRAEATDVANAILDGTDCVMLSGETSVGIDPVNVVHTMSKIIDKAEEIRKPVFMKELKSDRYSRNDLEIICKAAMRLANDMHAKAIITITNTGKSPKFLSSHRVNTDIIAVTRDEKISHISSLLWGVHILNASKDSSIENMVDDAIQYCHSKNIIEKKDKLIILHSDKKTRYDSANLLRVVTA